MTHRCETPQLLLSDSTILTVGAVSDGQFLRRSGSTIIGQGTGGTAVVAETSDAIPVPTYPQTTEGGRGDQTVFEGALYRINRPVTVNSIAFYLPTRSGSPTIRILIYQALNGVSGVANLVASVENFGPLLTSGITYVAPFTQGTVTFDYGELYIMQARDSAAGSYNLRTYGGPAYPPLSGDVPSPGRPARFTTVVAGTTSPLTFDPRVSPTGQAIQAGTLDTGGVWRLITP